MKMTDTERHYVMTDECHPEHLHLSRIRATRPIPHVGVLAGELGGWIYGYHNLADQAWVSGEAIVDDNARVSDYAHVTDHARLYAKAVVREHAFVADDSVVGGRAEVSGYAGLWGETGVRESAKVYDRAQAHNTQIFGEARVYGNARLYSGTRVYDYAQVFGNARIATRVAINGTARLETTQHYLHLGPIGSESGYVLLLRTSEGHSLRIGCWNGTIDELAEKVEDRSKDWYDEYVPLGKMEYTIVEMLVRARLRSWENPVIKQVS